MSCLALNQIELDATNRRLVILGTKHDKAEYPAKMRDNYCPHLNPSHRETLLSSHLKYELLRMAHKVTGTGHPFLQGRKGASHIMAGHALYDRIHNATLIKGIYRLVSIGVIKK
jgi:hypothetical protein